MKAPLFDELLARLVTAKVDFVLVGGLALGAWGVIRGTKDCDLVPDDRGENLERLAAVVVEIGGRVLLGDSMLGSVPSITALLRQGERTLITTRLGDLDVVQGLQGVPSYAALREDAVDVTLGGVAVAVCSLEDLRQMKKAAGRPRDLIDLDDLAAAQPDDPERS